MAEAPFAWQKDGRLKILPPLNNRNHPFTKPFLPFPDSVLISLSPGGTFGSSIFSNYY